MTARSLYEAVLIELNKENAPNILLEQFNYFANKAINNYINKRYNIYDISQQTTDDLRVLKSNATLLPKKVTDCVGLTMAGNNAMATYEVIMPSDYLHILNCICVYKVNKTYKCYNKGDYWRAPATRLTADMYSQVLDNFWNKPTYKKPYYYIHNVNTVNDSVIHNEDEPEPLPSDENYSVIHATTPTNPYIKLDKEEPDTSAYTIELNKTDSLIKSRLEEIQVVPVNETCNCDNSRCIISIEDYEIIDLGNSYEAIIWLGDPLKDIISNTSDGITVNGITYVSTPIEDAETYEYDGTPYYLQNKEQKKTIKVVNYILKHSSDYFYKSEIYEGDLDKWKEALLITDMLKNFYVLNNTSGDYQYPQSIKIGDTSYTINEPSPELNKTEKTREKFGQTYYTLVENTYDNNDGTTYYLEKQQVPSYFNESVGLQIITIPLSEENITFYKNGFIPNPGSGQSNDIRNSLYHPLKTELVDDPENPGNLTSQTTDDPDYSLKTYRYTDDTGTIYTYYGWAKSDPVSLKMITTVNKNETYYAIVSADSTIASTVANQDDEEVIVEGECELFNISKNLFGYIIENDDIINGLKQKKVLLQEIQKLVSRGENNGTDSVPNVLSEDNDGYLGIDGNGSLIIDGKGLPKTIRIGDSEVSNVERGLALRYGNTSEVRLEIRYGTDNSVFELIRVYVDYIKAPQNIRLTQKEIDLTEDTSQMLEYPDYVCQEIVNELVHLIMENISDGRLQTHPVVTLSIANPAQQLAAAQEA